MFCIKMNLSLSYVSVLVVLLIASANGRRFRRQDETTPAPAPGPEPGPAPAGGAKCYKCTSFENCAQNLTEMDCSTESIGNLSLGQQEKPFWDLAATNQSDLTDPTKSTHCIMVFWDGAEFRGCAPEKVGDKGICDHLQEVGKDTLVNCTVCLPGGGIPCNNANATYEKGGDGGEAKKGGAEKVSYDFITYVVSAILFKLMM